MPIAPTGSASRRRPGPGSQPGPAPRPHPLRAADVCVVTVTYGDRAGLCSQVVEAALAAGAGRVVVVDNGSGAESREALSALRERVGKRMLLVALPANTGSAGGFAAGLQAAIRDAVDQPLLWLLDDDNVPDEGALEELIAWYDRLSASAVPGPLALLSYRPQRSNFRRMVGGVPVKRVTGSRSSFLHFNLLDLPVRLWDRLRPRESESARAVRLPIALPEGPYGGLLIHRDVLGDVGLPDARLFTYSDDTEFTYRFTRAGGRIYLIPSSVVREVDEPWYDAAPGRTMLSRLLLAPSDFRVYFSTRNCVYFESRYWTGSPLLYRLNRFVVMSLLALNARILRTPARMALIRRSVAEGESGRLGGPRGGG